MRRVILSTLVIYMFLSVSGVMAQTVSPKPSPTDSAKNEVESLKDKIESTVSELAKKNKKAVAGKALSIEKNVINLQTDEGVRYAVKIDPELTKFYSIAGTSKKEVKLTDFEEGAYLIVSGPIADKEVSANSIYEDEQYISASGKIVEVDKAAFVVRVLTQQKQEYMLDIESGTAQQLLNIKTLEPEKIGFSKIKEGDEIHFVVAKGGEDTGSKNRYPAKRIFIIPQEYFLK